MVRRGIFATMTLAELFAAVALPLLAIVAACGGKLDRDASQRGMEEPTDGGGDARSSSGRPGASGVGGAGKGRGGEGGVGFAGEAGGGVATVGDGGAGGRVRGEGGTAEAGSGACPAYEVSDRVVFESLVTDPVVVWTGEEYAVIWSETHSGASYPFSEDHWYHILFQSLDRSGRLIARQTSFSTYQLDEHNVAIDVGTATVVAAAPGAQGRLGVVWCFHPSDDDDTLMFAQVNTSGVAVGEPVSIGRCDWGTLAALAWNESGYGLAWSCGGDICFVEVDESGVAVGETLQIPSTSLMAALFLFYDGEQYALAWNEFDSVSGTNRLLTIPPGASSLGQSVSLTDPGTHYADTLFVSPVDTGYLALWNQRAIADNTDDGLAMVRLDPAGNRLEDPHWFEEPAVVALRPNGSEYGALLAYRLEREDSSGLQYRFASLSPQGEWLTSEVTLGAAESPTSLVLHEWHETGYGVFFTARGVDGTSLAYAQLRCDR